ncbi:hypothetical protein HAX54_017507 [Datura stramonium]|uniref:Uncharacterized protein n=1 Tax=Datura stramonium TaxID=4076 RepID=A0ABS8S0R3_DATST|nr:hypothetical protein [Datura stramonium]
MKVGNHLLQEARNVVAYSRVGWNPTRPNVGIHETLAPCRLAGTSSPPDDDRVAAVRKLEKSARERIFMSVLNGDAGDAELIEIVGAPRLGA